MAAWPKTALVVLSVATLTACRLPSPDPNASALATSAFDQLRHGDWNGLTAEMSLKDWGPNPQVKLEAMRASLPKTDPEPGKLVGIYENSGTGGTVLALTYYYVYPDARVSARTLMAKDDRQPSGWIIRDIHIARATPAPTPQPEQPVAPVKPAPNLQQT